ncbi:putative epsilon-lactone hydrolase [Cadophora sp. DSE1049]|nr:putative epsilon-lactone hydrolase [Cadophora sp. DSE1049]
MARVITPTYWEILDILPALLSVLGFALYSAITGAFRGEAGADTYQHHLIQAVLTKATNRFSPLQLQYVSKSFRQIYVQYCNDKDVIPNFVTTQGGLSGFWLGSKDAKYVIINYHGGGFCFDATDEHLGLWARIQEELSGQGIETAWFFPMYTLTPHAAYPKQFQEAVEALRYVIDEVGRSPSDIFLSGDSAGGNLCIAVLSHLSHPSADAYELKIAKSLKGVVLLSPWVSFDTDFPSVDRNVEKDIEDRGVLKKMADLYLNGHSTNPYIEPLIASGEWWKGVKLEKALIVAGSDEVHLDSIDIFVRRFTASNLETTFVVARNECHIAPIVWPAFGDLHETEQEKAIKAWMKSNLG